MHQESLQRVPIPEEIKFGLFLKVKPDIAAILLQEVALTHFQKEGQPLRDKPTVGS